MASSKNRSNDTGDQPQRLGPARGPRGITKGRSNDSRSTDTAPNSRSQTPDIAPNKFALLDDDGDMDTLKSMPRSQSFNRDRRASEGIFDYFINSDVIANVKHLNKAVIMIDIV